MYVIDERDKVVELTDLPHADIGSPCAVVFASDFNLLLAYYLPDAGYEAGYDVPERSAVISFNRARSHMFGMPNDEAQHGHPLASRGLGWYGAYEVIDSSWIRQLERMNSVHERHDPRRFDDDRHLILTLKENMFECVAKGYEFKIFEGSPLAALRLYLDSS